MTQNLSRYTSVLCLAILIWSSTAVAQAPAADPWTRVPPIPGSCYASDDFAEKIGASKVAINAEIERQSAANKKAEEGLKAMDPLQQAQRMQEFMMKNPQEAMKIMQAMQGAGQTATGTVTSANDDAMKLEKELTTLKASYTAALDTAVKPIQAKRAEMVKTRTDPVGEGGAFRFKTAAFEAEYVANVKQENTEYEKVCASFLGPNGSFAKWLASYRTLVTEKLMGAGDEVSKAIEAQMTIMNAGGGGYKSTAKLEGIRNYLDKMSFAYPSRPGKPIAPGHVAIGR